jgi:hypothetical protein
MAQSGTQTKIDGQSISERLKTATSELYDLEKLVLSGSFSPRVLSEFRSAVDNVRQTSWAVQQWIGLEKQSRDPYSVMNILSAERVRRATEINKDLAIDLQSLEVGLETGGLKELFRAVSELQESLSPLFRRKP